MAALNLGEGREMLLARFCMKCGFLRLENRLPLLGDLLEGEAASPCAFSDNTVLKAEVLVSTWGKRAWVGLEAPLLPPGRAAAASATEAVAMGSTSDSLFLGLAFSTNSLQSPLRTF